MSRMAPKGMGNGTSVGNELFCIDLVLFFRNDMDQQDWHWAFPGHAPRRSWRYRGEMAISLREEVLLLWREMQGPGTRMGTFAIEPQFPA